jgi:hypothetical protein
MLRKTARKAKAEDGPLLIGWREKVSLPGLGIGRFIAKIDTGARSAALHATDIELSGHHVRFTVTIGGRNHHCELPLKGRRWVKSSNGFSEHRAVVETEVRIGRERLAIEVTLTDRTDMGVPMLLGRLSLGARFLVHPARSHILSALKRKAP